MQVPGLRQLLRGVEVLTIEHAFANRSSELRLKTVTLTLTPATCQKASR